jgi:hypothetical protein
MLFSNILTVTAQAESVLLLSAEEMRSAVGLADSSQDTALAELNARISSAIVSACKIAASGATPPTLRQETLTETFRYRSDPANQFFPFEQGPNSAAIVLSRRPVVTISSIVADTVTLVADTDFEVDATAALVYRLYADQRMSWRSRKVTVIYDAGWDEVPEDLKQAASRLASVWWTASGQDPNVRVDLTQDVGRVEYFGNPLGSGAIPPDVMDLLGPYINYPVV